MNEWNDTVCRRRMLILPALIVFLAGVLFGMAPNATETERQTREVFVGDDTISVTWESAGSTWPTYGILHGLVFVTDGSASLTPDLKSLSVIAPSATPADDGEVELPWEEAVPVLARVLANHHHLHSVLPGGDMDVIQVGNYSLFVPPALITSARLASAGFLDSWAKRRSVRRKLYEAAALRAVMLGEAQRFDEGLSDDLAAMRSGAVAMLGATDFVASSGLGVYTQLRIISGMQAAAAHGASTTDVAAKVTQRVSASTLGKSVQALGVLAFAVDLAEGVSKSQARQRLLAAAAADALVIQSLEDARRLLEGVNVDPAMTEGLSDAIRQLTAASQTRLEEYAETAGDALASSLPSLAGAAVAYLGTGGAALVVREATELGEELIGYSREVLTVSAMATLGIALRGRIESLVAGEAVGGGAADDYAMRELVTLHDRLGAEATATVYNMLWTDRWRNSSSLAGIAKGAGLTLVEWLTADADTERVYRDEAAERVRRVREGAAFAAALPEILGQLQGYYAGTDFSEGISVTTGVPVEAAPSVAANLAVEISFSGRRVIAWENYSAASVFAIDLDGDGDLDVLSGFNSFENAQAQLVWYENLGTGAFSERHPIATGGGDTHPVYAADLDGDGDLDLLSASSRGDKIAWYQNLGAGRFSEQLVIATVAKEVRVVHAADLDGDGDPDVLSAFWQVDEIAWYENFGAGKFSEQRVITTEANGATALYAADLDGDGDLDVLSASSQDDKIAWYQNLGAGTFSDQRVITRYADRASSVFAADLDGDGDADVLSASEYDDKIAWYENLGGTISDQRVIARDVDKASSVFVADLDGDGDNDVLSVSQGDDKVAWYENLGAGAFSDQRVITTSVDGAASVLVADLDGDGDADVLSASSEDGKIAWYENSSAYGNSRESEPDNLFSSELVIATNARGARSVYAADLDGDGDTDVLSASRDDGEVRWYENLSGKNSSQWLDFSQRVITTDADYASPAFVADLDGDGDADVLSTSNEHSKITWYENLGAGEFSDQKIVSTGAEFVSSLYAADLDGDEDLDVLSASYGDETIAWYENFGAGAFSEQRVIASDIHLPLSVFAVDLDGDGNQDVLSASGGDNKVAWYQNLGDAVFSGQHIITTHADWPGAVFTADLDRDGDMDVLSASDEDSKIAWYENLGSGAFSGQRIITTIADGPAGLSTADLDGDGDTDVLSASYDDDKIAWYENLGRGSFSNQRVITMDADGASSVFAADLNGDGQVDVISASQKDDKIAWYRNLRTTISATRGDAAREAEMATRSVARKSAFSEQRVITTKARVAKAVHATDLDGDGKLDVLSASPEDDKIAWHRNLGAGAFSGQRVISRDGEAPNCVFAADLDGDGDADVLSASVVDNKIAWFENRGKGVFSAQHIITTDVEWPSSLYAVDLDGDGDVDVLSASETDAKTGVFGKLGAIAWYENLGAGVFSDQRVITADVYRATSVYAADLDGDGDADVLSSSLLDNKIAWYENLGAGVFSGQRIISTNAEWASFVFAADLDGDGDADVLSASVGDDKIAWYENRGGGDFSAQHVVATGVDWVDSIYAADLDGDRDIDVLSASDGDDKITWYENLGGGAFSAELVISTEAEDAAFVFAADLDGDGDADVLSASSGDNKIAWYENLNNRRPD